ncbi:MAG TPA: DUF2934 domain-containing protein [Terriglobales bacterium]|jgi:hypothetical protein
MARVRNPRNGSGKNNSSASNLQAVSETKLNLVPINLEDEIRRRAYEIFEQRGSVPGDEREDWFRAEREIRTRYQHTA